jgi:uncharacterized membrane protein
LLLLAACGEAEPDPSACEPSWEEFGRGFVVEYCDACHASTAPDRHGAPLEVTFDTEEQALGWVDRIEVRVLAGEMPPGGGVFEEDLVMLQEWTSCH